MARDFSSLGACPGGTPALHQGGAAPLVQPQRTRQGLASAPGNRHTPHPSPHPTRRWDAARQAVCLRYNLLITVFILCQAIESCLLPFPLCGLPSSHPLNGAPDLYDAGTLLGAFRSPSVASWGRQNEACGPVPKQRVPPRSIWGPWPLGPVTPDA